MSDAEVKTPQWQDIISGRPEQKEAITSAAALTVVSAGAGTGKTHTLAQRFAWLLASDRSLSVDEVLVLTFTEKAAREMAERIGSTVEKWHSEFPVELKHLKESIKFMDDACISTIHSFAMKVIRESALTLDVDPTASIIPAPKEDLWWERYAYSLGTLSPLPLSRFLGGKWSLRAEELFTREHFSDFINEYGPNNLAEAAKTASETLGGAGKTPEELWNQDDANLSCDVESLNGYPGQVRDIWINGVLPDLTEETRSKPGKSLGRLMEILAEHSRLEADEDNSAVFCGLLFDEGLISLPSNSKLKDAISNALGESLKEWRDRERAVWLRAKPPSAEEKIVAGLLNGVCSLGWHCWDELRAKEDLLSMNDLIRYAGEALAKAPDDGSKKFKHILVDEFQDTDRLQDNLLRSLWNEDENTLFIVGDLKQSIYRFRHADLRIFQDYIAKAAAENAGKYKYITLDRSYRTKGELLGVFNGIFDNLWAGGLEKGTSMRYEPLAGPDDEVWWEERNTPQLLPVFEPCISASGGSAAEDAGGETAAGQEPKEGKETVSGARLRLFQHLGRRMSQMRGAGEKIWDKTAGAAGFREIRWSDFALLVRSRSVYPLIEKAFDAVGVPYTLCTSKNYFSRGEVADVVNLVALLAEPENPLYLAGWIASPLSGAGHWEARECMEEAQRRKEKKEKLPLAETVRQIIPAVWAEVERLRKLALLKGMSYAILELTKTRSFLAFYEPRQRRSVIANLNHLASAAGEYEASEGQSLASFADYLRMITISETQQEEPDAADEDEDAVRVLTIHASKGLEYPVVAVLCGGRRANNRGKIFISPRYGAGAAKIPSFLGGGKEDTVAYLWHGAGEKDRENAEMERLYYVALTRARDKVFLCSTVGCGKDGVLKTDSLDSFMQNVVSTVFNGEKIESHIVGQTETYQYRRREKIARGLKNKLLELPETSPAKLGRLSASAYAMLAWCPNAYRIAYRQGRNLRWVTEGGEGQGGADFGTLAHWILSRWDFTQASLGEWLPQPQTAAYERMTRLLPAYLREIFSGSAARGDLEKMLSAYAAGTDGMLMASLAAGSSLVRETHFRVLDKSLVLVGSTDVMWEDDASVHIRDWKTAAEDTAPDEYYRGQLEFYAYAVWRFKKNREVREKTISVALNYLRHGQSKSEPLCFGAGEMPELGSKIHSAAELALSGEFKKELSRCEKCPWRYDCLGTVRIL